MNKKWRLYLWFVVAICCWHTSAFASDKAAVQPTAGPFACGKFGANVINSPTADLGMIATAMFATPGVTIPSQFLEEGPWFLLDDYGSGPLMGCQPATSQWATDSSPRLNFYYGNGMLRQQIAQVADGQGGTTPVPLKFLYLEENPYRVTYAEQLCIGYGSTLLSRYTFSYTLNQLKKITVTQDAGCPDYAGTYTYTYNSAVVPNLPTNVDFVDGQGNRQTWQYKYQVTNNLLEKVIFGTDSSITNGYTRTLLRQMTISSPPYPKNVFVMHYTSGLQYLGYKLVGAPYDWGLTLKYANGKVVSALQNTACPPGACQPSVFTYATKRVLNNKDCFVTTRQAHVDAGRASVAKGYVYAKGSNQLLGPIELNHVVSLRQRGDGKFYQDPTCR